MAGRVAMREVARRALEETVNDGCLSMAAALAYYLFLALFPSLLFFVALASFFPFDALNRIVLSLSPFMPGEVADTVRTQVAKIAADKNAGLLTIGFLGAAWSSSAAATALIETINRAYGREDTRPWWRQRLLAVVINLVLAVFMLLSFTLIMAGPELAEPVARWFGLGRVWAVTWKIVQWPLVLVLIGVAFSFVYYAAPSGVRRGAALWPGAALATVTWLLASLGFRWYVQYFGDYNETYGTIAGAIIALLWLYLSGLCLLVGAELNSEIDNARASAARPVPPART